MCDKFWGDQPSDITNISNQLQPKKAWLCPCYAKTFRGLGTRRWVTYPLASFAPSQLLTEQIIPPKKSDQRKVTTMGFLKNKYQTKLKQTQWFHDTNPPHFTHAEQTGIHEDWHHAELPAGAMNWTLGVQRPFEIAPAFFFWRINSVRPFFGEVRGNNFLMQPICILSIPNHFWGAPALIVPGHRNILSPHCYPKSQSRGKILF